MQGAYAAAGKPVLPYREVHVAQTSRAQLKGRVLLPTPPPDLLSEPAVTPGADPSLVLPLPL